MEKIIPILPCPDIKVQIDFYKGLGFDLVKQYTAPNAYAVMKYRDIELHFYGTRKMIPNENATMCAIQVDEIDDLCEKFSSGLKDHLGKIPRTGIPRITKVRDLKEDRRFTLTDTGGNTFYICTPNKDEDEPALRTLCNKNHAKNFATLYDLVYSKEDLGVALNMLPKLLVIKDSLDDLDKAKLLLVALEIKREPELLSELNELIDRNKNSDDLWKKIEHRHNT